MIINQVGGGSGECEDWFLWTKYNRGIRHVPNGDLLTVTTGPGGTKSMGRYSASSGSSESTVYDETKHLVLEPFSSSGTNYAPSTGNNTASYQFSGTLPLLTKEDLINYMPVPTIIYGDWRITYDFSIQMGINSTPYSFSMGKMYIDIKEDGDISVSYDITGNLTISGYCSSNVNRNIAYVFSNAVAECVSEHPEDYVLTFQNSSGGFYGSGSRDCTLYINGVQWAKMSIGSSRTVTLILPGPMIKNGDVLTVSNSFTPSSVTVDESVRAYTFTYP